MNIVFFEIKPWETAFLTKKCKGHHASFVEESLQEATVGKAKQADIVSTFIYSQITASLIKQLPHLKLITTRSTGFDHIDLAACSKRGILVANVPNYGENTVAEHTFALILSLSRNIHKSYVRTLKGNFSIEGLTGFDLKGKTIGIIGGGKIGMHVAKIAKGFGMKVLVYDIAKNPFIAEVLNFSYASLDELLQQSDIVSLHVPYMKETQHLINKKSIALMKKGAIIINTSRGAIVDNTALLEALETKHLGGAGLDVIEGEQYIKEERQLLHQTDGHVAKWKTIIQNHKILEMDNVVFTPHNAFNSKEALQRILDITIENIEAMINKNPKNIVTAR